MAICKLCKQDKTLLNKSHIIPDFMYRKLGMYDSKHRVHKMEVQEFIKDKKKFKLIPTGEYVGGILCDDCDRRIIGGYESYARKALFGGGGLNPNNNVKVKNCVNPYDGREFAIVENIDYTKFKLFLLSILWRSAISDRTIFSDLKLTDEHIENLREMIYTGNAGATNDYPIITLSYLNDANVAKDIIGQPIRSDNEKGTFITYLIGGFIFIFWITKGLIEINMVKTQTINTNNTMPIMYLPRGQGWNFIMKFANVK